MSQIESIHFLEILDSCGTPAILCRLLLQNGNIFRASVPNLSLIDNKRTQVDHTVRRYHGKGLKGPIAKIQPVIDKILQGKSVTNWHAIDQMHRSTDCVP